MAGKMSGRGANSRRNQEVDNTIAYVQCDGLVSTVKLITNVFLKNIQGFMFTTLINLPMVRACVKLRYDNYLTAIV